MTRHRTVKPFTAREVASILRAAGIPVRRVVDGDIETTDDSIEITKKVSVQVGPTYLAASRQEDEETFTILPFVSNTKALVKQIRSLL